MRKQNEICGTVIHWKTILLVCAVILLLAQVAGCASGSDPEESANLVGLWVALLPDGTDLSADDKFYFEYATGETGKLEGRVHTFHKGVKMQEEELSDVRFSGRRLEWIMESTGVGYEGNMTSDGTTIEGKFLYRDGSHLAVLLAVIERSEVAGLNALPGGGEYTYNKPDVIGDGWETTTLAEAGLDTESFHVGMRGIVEGDYGQVHSLLVARNGKLIVEEYFYGYARDSLHALMSVTKSVTSLLVGIAVDRGSISGVDQPVFDFFPDHMDLKSERWDEVLLRHILTMTAGLGWDEESLGEFEESDNFFTPVLSRPVVRDPGSLFAYDSPNMDLLAGVLRHATGVHADHYAREKLFRPLGITKYDWDGGRRDGHPRCDGSLHMRPRDMAKIGELVLEGGLWNGERVVSEEWIRESIREHTSDQGREKYGYLWWNYEREFGGRSVEYVFANGWGSQFILVVPDLDVVVVTTGGNMDNELHFAPLMMAQEHILKPLLR